MSTEDRVTQMESAFATLLRLVQSHGERFDTHLGWLNELGSTTQRLASRMDELAAAQANTEEKLAALVNAQIRTEEQFAKLAETQNSLTEAQVRTEKAMAEVRA